MRRETSSEINNNRFYKPLSEPEKRMEVLSELLTKIFKIRLQD